MVVGGCWRKGILQTLEGSNFPSWIKTQGLQPAFQNRPSPWPEWGRHQVRGPGRSVVWLVFGILHRTCTNGNLLADSERQIMERKTSPATSWQQVIFCNKSLQDLT